MVKVRYLNVISCRRQGAYLDGPRHCIRGAITSTKNSNTKKETKIMYQLREL